MVMRRLFGLAAIGVCLAGCGGSARSGPPQIYCVATAQTAESLGVAEGELVWANDSGCAGGEAMVCAVRESNGRLKLVDDSECDIGS
jgi:hypothetical protein